MSTFRKYQYWKKKHPDALGEIYAVWNTKELNPEGDPKVYFGQADKGKKRWRDYEGVTKSKKKRTVGEKYFQALCRTPWKDWKPEVAVRAPAIHLDILETAYIWKFKAQNLDYGYNTLKGGKLDATGIKRSKETRRKQSEAHKGRTYDTHNKKPVTHIYKEKTKNSYRVAIFGKHHGNKPTWKEAVALRNAKYAELGLDHLVNDTPNPYE